MNNKKLLHIGVTAILVLSVLAMLTAGASAEGGYTFVTMWPESPQLWCFDLPSDIAVDSTGNVYVADTGNDRIQKFDSVGNFVTKWGSYGTGDGEFRAPSAIAVDISGNVFVADTRNHRIQKFDSDGNFITKWGSSGTGDGKFIMPEGIAVDSSGNVFVADSYDNRIQKFDSGGTFITKWGEEGTGDGEFDRPFAIAVDSTGNVYVADANNHRIQKFDSDGNFITKWGEEGTGNGKFKFPSGIAVGSSGNVFVADSLNECIQKFDSVGNFITKWGSWGGGDGEFYAPSGIAVDSTGNVFVVDGHNYRIQKFDSVGNFITKWGSECTGDGKFKRPEDIAVDSSGNVFVVDSRDDRIQKFDSVGNFITKWGSWGGGDGEFHYPDGIAADSSGNVYVADTSNQRIQKFDSVGNFITKWGSEGSGEGEFNYPHGIAADSSSNVYVADSDNGRIQKFDSVGNFITKWGSSGDGEFYSLRGIAVDSSSNVYVAESGNARIQKFDSVGNFITKWGSWGGGDGEFYYPNGIAVDTSGNVFVADTYNHRIQKFDSVGTFITKWGSHGCEEGEFNYPNGIAVDTSGNVFVADTYNHRIQKFAPSIPEEPSLSFSPSSHDFGDMCEGDTDSTTFELWNSGTGTLIYSLSETCGWVEVNPTSGSSTGEHDTLTVDIDTTGLSEGLHTCDITINSNGGTGTFTVTVNVMPLPNCTCGDICVNTTGWWRDGGAFNLSDTPIQNAIDNATAGDTICVKGGTYTENVDVNTPLTIKSENGADYTTVQAASSSDHVFAVTADYVTISGFTVKGAGDSHGISIKNSHYCEVHDNIVSFNDDRGIVFGGGGDNAAYNNIVHNNSGYGAIEAIDSDNNTIYNNTAYYNRWGIATNGGSNNWIHNNTIYENDHGVYLDWPSTGNIVSNNNISSNGQGIFTNHNSTDNIITCNSVFSNFWTGIHISTGNNVIDSNTVTSNGAGIRLSSASNNIITSNTASKNSIGISLSMSSNNTIANNIIENNNDTGIILTSYSNHPFSDNNTIEKNTIVKNKDGIVFFSAANNTVRNNIITGNTNFGLAIWFFTGYSTHRPNDNSIYNNYFNNTNNARDSNSNNIWNTTKTLGTNIIGGPYLGGNYWSDYAGKDTNGDGLGDTLLPYCSNGGITNGGDYHPLVPSGFAQLEITSFAPPSPVNDTICTWRTFNVTVNQSVNVSWYLNGSMQQTNESVTEASCTLHANVSGEHNVTAKASNANGTDSQTWIWNVTEESSHTFELFTGWNMISFPVEPLDNDADTIFGPEYYYLCTWDPDTGCYVPVDAVETEIGYWLLVLEDRNVTVLGTPLSEYNTSMTQGWNMIGSLWAATNVPDGTETVPADQMYPYIYGWCGDHYELTQDIEPGLGYWALAYIDCELHVFPAPSAAPLPVQQITWGDNDWRVRLAITSGAGTDVAEFGLHEDATYDFSAKLDVPEPPSPPPSATSPYQQVYFYDPENPLVNKLSTSYIPHHFVDDDEEYNSWLFSVDYSGDASDVTIKWNAKDINAVQAEYSLLFIADGEQIDMRTTPSYTFRAKTTRTYEFEIRAITGGKKPDLVIEEEYEKGKAGSYTVFFVVKNIGTATAPEGHYATLYVDGVEKDKKLVSTGLEPGETYESSFKTKVGLTGKVENVKVCADSYDDVDELDEANNCLKGRWQPVAEKPTTDKPPTDKPPTDKLPTDKPPKEKGAGLGD